MTRFEDRTPRRRRGLKRQRRNEYAGSVVRIFEKTIAQVRAGKLDKVPEPMLEQIRILIKGEPIEDPNGQPSTISESARQHLADEFNVNGSLAS